MHMRQLEALVRQCLWLALGTVVCLSVTLRDSRAQSAAEPRRVQYLFVLDDSRSMRQSDAGRPGTDENRLAVFAIRAIVALLDDADEVGLIALNQDLPGNVSEIRPLRDARVDLAQALELGGKLAGYNGPNTICRAALDKAAAALNAKAADNAQQIVMFLTDGSCDDVVNQKAFLSKVDSRKRDALSFFLLAFKGGKFSAELAAITKTTTSEPPYEMNADQPAGLLEPLARAVTFAQGIPASPLDPRHTSFPPHSAAKRVRLLAIAPETGPDLEIAVTADRGGNAIVLEGREAGTHRFGGEKAYRFATVKYKPVPSSVKVSVANAGDTWKVIALPEYDLQVSTALIPGKCGDAESEGSVAEVGGAICVRVTLKNGQGHPVPVSDLEDGATLALQYKSPREEQHPVELNPSPDGLSGSYFRPNLDGGDHTFQGIIRLRGGTSIRGRGRTLVVSSQQAAASPKQIDAGAMVPGGTFDVPDFVVSGTFGARKARVAVGDRDEQSACVTFAVSGEPEGRSIQVSAGQKYNVAVRVLPFCGPTSFSKDLRVPLRLVFDNPEGQPQLPPLEVPTRLHLDNVVEVPKSLDLRVEGGKVSSVPIRIGGNHTTEIQFRALLPKPGERKDWPQDDLTLAFGGDDGAKGENAAVLIVGRAGADSELRASAGSCCGGGMYHTEVALAMPDSQVRPLRIPVNVEVVPGGVWRCYGTRVVRGLAGLLGLLLLVYLVKLFSNRCMIDPDAVAQRIKVWDGTRSNTLHKTLPGTVKRQLRKVSTLVRIGAWLRATKAWPFGRAYKETWRISFDRDCGVRLPTVESAERDFLDAAHAPGKGLDGWLYVTAEGPKQVTFWVVRDVGKSRSPPAKLRVAGGLYEAAERRVGRPLRLAHTKFVPTGENVKKWPSFEIT